MDGEHVGVGLCLTGTPDVGFFTRTAVFHVGITRAANGKLVGEVDVESAATSLAPSCQGRGAGPDDSGHPACKHRAGSRSCDLPVIARGSLYSLYPN